MHRLVLISAIVTSSLALAAEDKKEAERKAVKDTELKKESTGGPAKDLAGSIERKKTESGKAAPALSYDQFRLGIETQVAGKRREQIRDLEKIIELAGKDKQEMPKLLFRLGELYWEESQYYFFEANRKDDEYIKAMNAGDEAGKERAKSEKEELLSKQKENARIATEKYAEIVQKYKDFDRTDEVLYFLGKNLMDMGDEKKSLVAYKRLIEKFPKSKYLPDAHLAFGEYYFNNSKAKRDVLEKALASYKAAAGFPDSHVYAFALYKQGWCYFNLTEYEKAMDQFKAVILYAEIAGTNEVEGQKGKPNARTGLVKESRNDYVRSYARIPSSSPSDGKERFSKLAKTPDDLRLMMKQLALLYYEDGKDKEAALAFNMLINERPSSPEAPGFQSKVIDCVLRAGNKQMTVQQVRRLVKIMDDVMKANPNPEGKDKTALEEARELAERILSNLAVTWHNECRKTRDEDCYRFANDVYGDYLTLFPENSKAYDLRFFWAELLNDNLNKYEQSAAEYTKVMLVDVGRIEKKDDKGNPGKPGKWMLNAAFNSILANEEVVKIAIANGKLKPPEIKDPSKPVEIPPEKKALLDACERYIKYVPNGEKKVEIAYKAARIYYDYNDLEESVKRFTDITLNYADHKFEDGSKPCVITGNLVIDAFNLRGDTKSMNEYARKFANEKCAQGNPDFKQDMYKLAEQTTFKLANALDAQKDYLGAAKAYTDFINEFPKSELADKAMFNASIDFFNGKMLDKAIETRKRIIKEYSKSSFVPNTMFALAEGYEAIADFDNASDYYELYAENYEKSIGKGGKKDDKPEKKKPATAKKGKKGDKGGDDDKPVKAGEQVWEESKAKIAVFNSGVFRDGLGQYGKALANREKYLRLWPEDKDSEAVFLSIVDLHERNAKYKKAAEQLEEYERKFIKDSNKVLTAEGRIQALWEDKMKNKPSAQKICKRILGYYDQLPKKTQKALEITALDPVGRCNFQANEDDYKKYLGVKLKWSKLQNVGELKGSIKDKSKALEGITKLYTETVSLKSADPAICALHKIGLSYEQFADQLSNPPVPKGVPEDLLLEIKAQFDEQARPIKDKAAEAFAAAVQKSQELDVYNKCTTDALDKLRDKFKPDQFPQMPEDVLDISVEGSAKNMAIGNDVLTAVQPLAKMSGDQLAGATRGVSVKEPSAAQDLGDAPPPKNKNKNVAKAEEPEAAPSPSKKKKEEPAPEPESKPAPAKKGGGDAEPEDSL
ncbi:MAG: tetratricopeptide repeat protein [Archangiaceae bacterium]|nr:tetratricopeptide repeat protein [Archangiaceae bacterium]